MKPKELKRREAQERQERWDNMTSAERFQQKVEQGNGETSEAELLLAQSLKE